MATLAFTTVDGILHADIWADMVTITLKPDDGGADLVIEVPSFKFAWIVEAFAKQNAEKG
jgi:glutamine cyclotransferase